MSIDALMDIENASYVQMCMYVHVYIITGHPYKKETLPFATTGMDLEDVMLSNIRIRQIP